MLHFIYAQPPLLIVLLMAAVLALWCRLAAKIDMAICWRRINLTLAAVSVGIILYTTILSRVPGVCTVVLAPFVALAAAKQQPELYREMLMNVFLFFPLGLTLSGALPQTWHRWWRIILTILVGCVLSAGIEYAQYCFALGMAETDDVICNTLGAFIGSTSLLIDHAMEQRKEGFPRL